MIGNERWLDGTLATSRSSPVTVPSDIQEKLDRHSTLKYSAITFDKSTDSYDTSYGMESLPAICEYGTDNCLNFSTILLFKPARSEYNGFKIKD